MISNLIDVCQKYHLTPEQGVTYMMRAVASILHRVGVLTNQPNIEEFVYHIFQDTADQLKNSLDSH